MPPSGMPPSGMPPSGMPPSLPFSSPPSSPPSLPFSSPPSFPPSSLIDVQESDRYLLGPALVGIASTIANLRGIDLTVPRTRRFRSAEAMQASNLYQELSEVDSERKQRYLLSIFPLLPSMDANLYAELLCSIASLSPREMSQAVFDYELILRQVMEEHGEASVARTLAIGSRTSTLLDPLPVGTRQARAPRMEREAVLHDVQGIRTPASILASLEQFSSSHASRAKMLCSYISTRTGLIALSLDNRKRVLDVEMYNRAIQKSTPAIACRRTYEKKLAMIEICRARRKYLLEHIELVKLFLPKIWKFSGLSEAASVSRERNAELSALDTKRLEADIYVLDLPVSDDRYARFYRTVIYPAADALRKAIDDECIALTAELSRSCRDGLEVITVRIPLLIGAGRHSARQSGNAVAEADPTKISIRHRQAAGSTRHREKGTVVADFSVAAKREAELVAANFSGMSAEQIISTARETLISISTSRSTTKGELTAVAKMLTLVSN